MDKVILGGLLSLVGVVVGGLMTGAVQWWHAHQARRRATRAAKRLLLHELALTAMAFSTALDQPGQSAQAESLRASAAAGLLSDELWIQHRLLLAEELQQPAWKTVSKAFLAVSLLRSQTQQSDASIVAYIHTLFKDDVLAEALVLLGGNRGALQSELQSEELGEPVG